MQTIFSIAFDSYRRRKYQPTPRPQISSAFGILLFSTFGKIFARITTSDIFYTKNRLTFLEKYREGNAKQTRFISFLPSDLPYIFSLSLSCKKWKLGKCHFKVWIIANYFGQYVNKYRVSQKPTFCSPTSELHIDNLGIGKKIYACVKIKWNSFSSLIFVILYTNYLSNNFSCIPLCIR